MRILIVAGDGAMLRACCDYYEAVGCEVDVGGGVLEADSLVRFRDYDFVMADLPMSESGRGEVDDVLRSARRYTDSVRLVLATNPADAARFADTAVVLTKPFPLCQIFELQSRHVS